MCKTNSSKSMSTQVVLGKDEIGLSLIIQLNAQGKIVAMFKITAYTGCPL